MVLEQFKWLWKNSNGSGTIRMVLEQFKWFWNNSNGSGTIQIFLDQYEWSELGNQFPRNQILVINLTIVIHIQVIVTFFFLFHSQVIFKSFSKKSYFLIDYVNMKGFGSIKMVQDQYK